MRIQKVRNGWKHKKDLMKPSLQTNGIKIQRRIRDPRTWKVKVRSCTMMKHVCLKSTYWRNCQPSTDTWLNHERVRVK